jgi:GntR family transcriptional regulator
MRRLRFLDRIPIAVEEIWLDADSGDIDPNHVSDSLYQYYKKKLGFWVSRAEDYVSIGRVPDWAPADIDQNHGDVTGYITRLSWEQKPYPVEYSRTWFNPDKAHYVQRLK